MAAGGRGARRNAGGEPGWTDKAEAKRVMKPSELVCARAIMGAVWLATQKDLSKFGHVKIWLCQSWSHAKTGIVSVLFMAKPKFGYAKI